MIRQTLTVALFLLGAFSQAQGHLRQRNDGVTSIVLELVPEEQRQEEDRNLSEGEMKASFEKIEECFGDCDSTDDCGEGLFCYHRSLDNPSVPGCSFEDNSELYSTKSVCVAQLPDHATEQTLLVPSRSGLLGLCQGDCESDEDCLGDLVCLERGSGDAIPGCGNRYLGTKRNYCIQPTLSESGDDGSAAVSRQLQRSGSFRLKVYWENGYRWQGEAFERFWCLVRDYNVGGTCWDAMRRKTCRRDEVYVTRCGSGYNQRWSFVSVGGGEVMIQASGEDKCLTRYGVAVVLTSCNGNSNSQRFFAPRGDLGGYRFELSQLSSPSFCLNQDHHPKNAEWVHMIPCSWSRSRSAMNSYWERY